MTQHVLLNSVDHHDLRVITTRGAGFGENQWFCPTFPLEFRSVQADFPIFFHKDSQTGQFFPVAIFGFSHHENLFLEQGIWDNTYWPLALRRQPFLIGQQLIKEDGVERAHRVLHIDLDHPRVSKTAGEPLFLPFGGNSQLLDDMASLLETLHHGMQDAKQLVTELLALQLLEGVTLDITLDNGQKHQMIGFYTINEDKLANLDAATLHKLQQQGYLQAIYMVLASQSNIRHLIQLKNQQLKQQQAG
ncbi:MAG: SapC family protein [Gammaproteobacteria bacterium]|jgi:hypothetical protein|nr:SapC family protein [Gammaproteobacteria bacterium]